MLRKKGLILLAVIVVIFLGLNIFVTDGWVERRIESLGSSIVGARVELEGLKLSLLKMRVQWRGLEVTDPKNTWYNLFETGRCNFHIASEPLLSRKFIVEDVEVRDLRFNAKRKTDGRLPERRKAEQGEPPKIIQKMKENLQSEIDKVPVFQIGDLSFSIDPEALWERVQPESPEKMRSLTESYREKFSEWAQTVERIKSREDLESLEAQVKSINVEKLNTPEGLQRSLITVNDVSSRLTAYTSDYRETRSSFEDDFADFERAKRNVDTWIEKDYNRALELIQIPDISRRNIAILLFGESVVQRVERVSDFIGKVRFYSEKAKKLLPRKEKTPRFKGQDILFEDFHPLPNFWIKNVDLSGVTQSGIHLKGSIENIVSRQDIIDSATTLEIFGEREGKSALRLAGVIDHRTEEPSELLKLEIEDIPLAGTHVTDFPLLPSTLSRGQGSITASIDFKGSKLRSTLDFRGKGVHFEDFEGSSEMPLPLTEMRREIADSIQDIDLTVALYQDPETFTFSIRSSVDDMIARRAASIADEEMEKARGYFRQRFGDETQRYMSDLERLENTQIALLKQEFALIDAHIQSLQKLVLNKRRQIEERTRALLNRQKEKASDKLLKEFQNILEE